MRIDESVRSAAGFPALAETLRQQTQPAPLGGDSVTLSVNPNAAKLDVPGGGAPAAIFANADAALAAHSRLNPERALRLLGLLVD